MQWYTGGSLAVHWRFARTSFRLIGGSLDFATIAKREMEIWAEAAACLAFARLSPYEVEILTDI